MKMFNKNKSGFSLIEFVVYLGLLGGISVFVAGTFISVSQGSARAEAGFVVNSNIRYALDRIRQDIKDSANVLNPISGSLDDSLKLQVGSSEITYDVLSGVLRRQIDSNTPQNITPSSIKVDSIVFRLFENTNIPINKIAKSVTTDLSVSFNSTSPGYGYSQSLSKTASLEAFFEIPGRGSFGSPGGGCTSNCGGNNCLSRENYWWEIIIRKVYASSATDACDNLQDRLLGNDLNSL